MRRTLMATAIVILVLFLLFSQDSSAQSERELVNKARAKLKLKKHVEACVILKDARRQYPESIEVAGLWVTFCEQTKAGPEELIAAHGRLAGLLKSKEATGEKLTSKESGLLKKTQKKLDGLLETRREADAVIEEFIAKGIELCRKLKSGGQFFETSFVFQRLSAAGMSPEQKAKLSEELGIDKTALVTRLEGAAQPQSDNAKKLVQDAQSSLRRNKLKEARIAAKAALDTEPGLSEARALLFFIAERQGETGQMLEHGLTYLLFSPEAQSVKHAAQIEEALCAKSPELKGFFDSTAKAADGMSKVIKKAMRKKKDADVEYMLRRLMSLTHLTKKVESVLSKGRAQLAGVKIFNGRTLAGWLMTECVSVRDGCLAVEGHVGGHKRTFYSKLKTGGSFTLHFSLQVEKTGLKEGSGPKTQQLVFATFWDDGLQASYNRAFLTIAFTDVKNEVQLMEDAAQNLKQISYGNLNISTFESGKWYKMRIKYDHAAANITLFVNDKKAATVSVPDDFFPMRTGFVGLGQQHYKYVKFRDIHLAP